MAQNSNVPRSQEDYITKVSGEIEGRVTKMLCQDVTTTESRILGAPLRLNEILLNASIQDHSGTTPETSRITLDTNQGMNEDDSKCDYHPEASNSQSQNTRSCGPDDACDMVTGVPEEITYCSSRMSSGTQMKTRSAS